MNHTTLAKAFSSWEKKNQTKKVVDSLSISPVSVMFNQNEINIKLFSIKMVRI